jgi:hypothetical protein
LLRVDGGFLQSFAIPIASRPSAYNDALRNAAHAEKELAAPVSEIPAEFPTGTEHDGGNLTPHAAT